MELIWSKEAQFQLSQIYFYYKKHFNSKVANNVKLSIYDAVKLLKTYPNVGSVCEKQWDDSIEFRAFVEHKNHKIIYYIENNTVYIADIWACNMDH